jgi:hypothetical protein
LSLAASNVLGLDDEVHFPLLPQPVEALRRLRAFFDLDSQKPILFCHVDAPGVGMAPMLIQNSERIEPEHGADVLLISLDLNVLPRYGFKDRFAQTKVMKRRTVRFLYLCMSTSHSANQ